MLKEERMNHDQEGGWTSWLPMMFCCVVMVAVILLFGVGIASLR
jgi:hypothetical protein